MYWTPPLQTIGPPLLKSDDLFFSFREPRDIGPPPFKNPGHAPAPTYMYEKTCGFRIKLFYEEAEDIKSNWNTDI